MNFFETRRGHYYPVSAIVWISQEKKDEQSGTRYHTVYFNDADDTQISTYEFERLKRETVGFIPAQPGTNIVRTNRDDDFHWRVPVIGWAISADSMVRPVTPEGLNDNEFRDVFFPVEMPNGQVIGDDSNYSSVDEMMAERRRDRERGPFLEALSKVQSVRYALKVGPATPELEEELAAAQLAFLDIAPQSREQLLLRLLEMSKFTPAQEFGNLFAETSEALRHVR